MPMSVPHSASQWAIVMLSRERERAGKSQKRKSLYIKEEETFRTSGSTEHCGNSPFPPFPPPRSLSLCLLFPSFSFQSELFLSSYLFSVCFFF